MQDGKGKAKDRKRKHTQQERGVKDTEATESGKKANQKKQKTETPAEEGKVLISLQRGDLLKDSSQLFAVRDRIENNTEEVDNGDVIPLAVKASHYHPTPGTVRLVCFMGIYILYSNTRQRKSLDDAIRHFQRGIEGNKKEVLRQPCC